MRIDNVVHLRSVSAARDVDRETVVLDRMVKDISDVTKRKLVLREKICKRMEVYQTAKLDTVDRVKRLKEACDVYISESTNENLLLVKTACDVMSDASMYTDHTEALDGVRNARANLASLERSEQSLQQNIEKQRKKVTDLTEIVSEVSRLRDLVNG